MKARLTRLEHFPFLLATLLSLTLGTWALPAQALAASSDRKVAKFASGTGFGLSLALGVGLPLLEDKEHGSTHSLRSLDALGTAALLSEGLKQITHERRPDGSSRDSFPSGHTTGAFAVAAMESHFHPRQ